MLRAMGMQRAASLQRCMNTASEARNLVVVNLAPSHSPSRVALRAQATAAPAPQEQGAPQRVPAVPLYKGLQVADAVSAAQGHLDSQGAFTLAIRNEPQAAGAMRLLLNLAEAQKQTGKRVQFMMFSLRLQQGGPGEQQQQQQPGTFNFRQVLRCEVAEPRSLVPEKEIKVAKQSSHRDIANRAFDVLKEEALKTSQLPTVSLLSIGSAAHVQTFKAIHSLRIMLRNIRRGLVVQLDENKSQREGAEEEVLGLRYNIYLEELPETPPARESQNAAQVQ